MKFILSLLLVALILVGAAAAALAYWPIEPENTVISLEGDAARGAYLARMSGCIACHTNSEKGGAPLAGGVALKTNFGTFYTPNLTTDKEFGIGAWTVGDFTKAVRHGISKSGEPYYPAFPYPFYSKLSDQDIADLWAAFQTVPAVSDPSKPLDLNFPFNFRPGLKLWRYAFLDEAQSEPVLAKSAAWNRGKYIVEGPAHCGACHTPRNLAGAREIDQRMEGAGDLPNGGKSPPITSTKLLAEGWTFSNLKYALRTGVRPDGDVFGGAMGEIVREGTSFLNDNDLAAISIYLLDEE
ncbi:MAG: cytochrome C [Hyphomicrobiales bacterium]|nr:MAG: cytochrome C [Hyphomicrobiales bacterium]